MVNIEKTWTDLKVLADDRKLKLQYTEYDEAYELYAVENQIIYLCTLTKDAGADVTDFETNYKADSNQPITPTTDDGKHIIRSESRPLNTTTWFTGAGDKIDAPLGIGAGKKFTWDFSNSDDDVTAPTGYKMKRIEFSFIDSVWIKEGALYFFNTVKGSSVSMMVVCPSGEYYYKNDGTLALAAADTVVNKYLCNHHIQDNCPMGDELNTESCSGEIPANYKFWMEITVPDSDATSNGAVSLEMYRTRTNILE